MATQRKMFSKHNDAEGATALGSFCFRFWTLHVMSQKLASHQYDVRVNPTTLGISINFSSFSMASHIFSTDVHAALFPFHSCGLISVHFFYHVENGTDRGGACMHPCADGGGCLCQVMQHKAALGVGSGAFTSPGSYFRNSS